MYQTDFLLYGGVAVVAGIIFLGYRFFRKRNEGKPKNEAMKKISDFFATQDQNHNY